MKSLWKYLILILIIFALASGAIFAYNTVLKYVKDKYSPNEDIVEYYCDEYTDLVIDFKRIELEKPVKIVNNEILIRYEIIKEHIDPHIYYDEARGKVIITTADKVIWLTENSLVAEINKKELLLDTASQQFDGILYVPVRAFSNMWQINVKYLKDNDIVIVESYRNFDYTATLNIADAAIRQGASIKQPIYIASFPQNQVLYISSVIGEWTSVMTANGVIGYVESKYLNTNIASKEVIVQYEQKKLYLPDHVILSWHYVHTSTVTNVPYYADVNVISPTFFTVVDEIGTISSSASLKYVQNAHDRGYTVWPLVNNIFAQREQIGQVLADSEARRYVIDQLLTYAFIYEFDGINVDFENLYITDKENLVQFIRELVPLAHEMNLAVSIDVGIPGGSEGYSLCYDHLELGKAADYVMVMTYDQFWSSHQSGGSQAQLSWVEVNVKRTLKLIPADKLVIGIPAYTRLWKTDETGKVTLHRTLTANQVLELVESKQLTPIWEQEREGFISGQYYLEYKENKEIYRAWIEDDSSARLKAQLASKYKLKGVCVWMMSQTNKPVWEAILEGFHSTVD